jgi:hypothetical protein
MEIITRICQNGIVIFTLDEYLNPDEATALARARGLTDKIEITHLLTGDGNEIIYSQYIIDKKNRRVSAIYPHRNLMPKKL